MQVMLKFRLKCTPQAAWKALHSPSVGFELYGPVIRVQPVDPLPRRWQSGDHAVIALKLFGAFPLGVQSIKIHDYESQFDGQRVRIMRDHGGPLSGPLSLLRHWDHQMGISEVPNHPNKTVWRERLEIDGVVAPLFFPVLWVIWQLRARRLRRLAKRWQSNTQ